MRIAIDCADLDYSRIDGTRVYIKNLLDWFGESGDDEFLLYHKKEFNRLLEPKKFPNYMDKKIPYSFWWTQTRFAFELRQDKPDVCWMPIQQIPFIGPKSTKYVVTIHDLAFKIFKDHFNAKDRFKLNFFADTAINNANKIIAISEATKKDILKFYPKVSGEKITVVHHGFDVEGFSRKHSQEKSREVLEKYGIIGSTEKSEYLLYVGAIQPRKNLITLIEAFENIKKNDSTSKKLKLVFVGEAAWLSEAIIDRIKSSAFSVDIIQTGKVDFRDLACLYQAAEVFVYPSLYEGFGIPILEAFASGVPVVSADNSSLIEVGGDAARKFSANDAMDLSNTLQRILNNRTIKEEMIALGFERAKQFSWKKCAEKTLKVLKEI